MTGSVLLVDGGAAIVDVAGAALVDQRRREVGRLRKNLVSGKP